MPLNLEKADDVRVSLPAGLGGVAATVVARHEGKEVGRLTRFLAVLGAPPAEDELFLDVDEAPLEKDRVVYKLEAPVANVAVGGGGRYLILHLPKLNKLAVFDVNKAKVVKLLPAPDSSLKFTAGLNKLLVALPKSRIIQRWNLETLELEFAAPYPGKDPIMALSLGAASSGPAFMLVKSSRSHDAVGCLLDLEKLDRQEMAWTRFGRRQSLHIGEFDEQLHVRSSSDGKSTALWTTAYVPSGMHWLRWNYPTAHSSYSHSSNGHVLPGPRGKILFTGYGMYTGLDLANAIQNKHYAGSDPNGRYLPAHHADYYLFLGIAPTPAIKTPPRTVSIHKLGMDKPVLRLDGVEVPITDEQRLRHDFTLDKRFHLIPQAKLLVVIPPSNDQLVLYRVDLEDALRKATAQKK